MKCHHHPEREAVAVCRACGRAACRACGLETGSGLACRPECAESLEETGRLHSLLAAHLRNIRRLNILGSFFSLGMGLLFSYFSFLGRGIVYDFILLLGAGFTVYGLAALLLNLIIFLKRKN